MLNHVDGYAVIAGILTTVHDQAVTDFNLIGAVSRDGSMPFRSISLAVKSATLNWPDPHYCSLRPSAPPDNTVHPRNPSTTAIRGRLARMVLRNIGPIVPG
jgi:hypothetical protein